MRTHTKIYSGDPRITANMGRKRKRRISIKVPSRITARWCNTRPGKNDQFLIGTALSEAKVSEEEFKKCWKKVQPTIPQEDLVRLLVKTFGSGNNLHRKVDFIKHILRRYRDIEKPVCDCVTCFSFVSTCCVGLLLYQYCILSSVLIALTD